MRLYANEGRHLLPAGQCTGVPQARYHRTVVHAHVTTRHVYVLHVPEQYHTLVTTGQCHTLVTTEQYHILLPHEITTPSILHRGVYHMIITTGQTTTLVTTVIVV